ncbi:efflux RND transporter periplasmic adaptor subunit [Roseicyclus sp.]
MIRIHRFSAGFLAGFLSGLAAAGAAVAQVPEPLTCLLAPARVSAVGTDVRGIVADVPVDRADFVEEGAVLLQMDDTLARADLGLAEITVAALRPRAERAARLADNRLIPSDELDQLRTDLALAEAELARATEALERSVIRAPFAGYVAQVGVAEGELTGTDPLLQLIDVATLKAEMTFLDGAFGELTLGQVVNIAVDLVGAEVAGEITVIDPFLDAASNTFSVVAEIPNSDLGLPAGAACRVIPE